MNTSQQVNPYIAGNPVKGTGMFFGRQDVFSFVQTNLTGRHSDTPIVLYGQRRTGKTSVLYQMHRHLDPRYRCILIDLHSFTLSGGMENLLWDIAISIKRGLQRSYQLRVTVPDRTTFRANPQREFRDAFLDSVWSVLGEDHLVLMIDEVARFRDEVDAGRLERDVFDYFRHLMQHFERLNFIFSIGSAVEELKKDDAFLFSVALYRRISFLDRSAAQALITEPVQGCYHVTPDAVDKILQITTGHPYYTQLICHRLFDQWLQAPKPQMTSGDIEDVLTDAIVSGSANLAYVWEDSTPEEQAVMAGMAAAMRGGNLTATIDQIRQMWDTVGVPLPAGVATKAIRNLVAREVVASDEAYSFRVDLQRLWLEKHRRLDWVKEELRETAQNWVQPATADTSTVGKPPDRQRWRVSKRGMIIAAISAGILALVFVVIVFTSNLHSTPGTPERTPSAAAANSIPGQPHVVRAVGQSYVASQDGVPAATITVTAVQITTTGYLTDFPPQNGYFAIATVNVKTMPNLYKGFYISEFDFQALSEGVHLEEGNGNAIDAIDWPADHFGNVTLPAGKNITKKLVFDVPSKHGAILYAPDRNQVVAEWNYL